MLGLLDVQADKTFGVLRFLRCSAEAATTASHRLFNLNNKVVINSDNYPYIYSILVLHAMFNFNSNYAVNDKNFNDLI
jgi:hypothetical protein